MGMDDDRAEAGLIRHQRVRPRGSAQALRPYG